MMYFYSVIQKTASLFIFIGAAIYPFHSVPLYDKLPCLRIMNRCLHCCPQMQNKSYIYQWQICQTCQREARLNYELNIEEFATEHSLFYFIFENCTGIKCQDA